MAWLNRRHSWYRFHTALVSYGTIVFYRIGLIRLSYRFQNGRHRPSKMVSATDALLSASLYFVTRNTGIRAVAAD
jgi:hypothetical protein